MKAWKELREQAADNLKYINETLVATIKAQGVEIRSLRELKSGDPRLIAECDALKESNAELREQLSANAETISKLQHNVRLVQETHAQQVRECAEKAAQRIEGSIAEHQTLVNIICEAFGVPVKDECEEALQTEWRRMELAGEAQRSVFNEFRKGFITAWNLAKESK